ncbi:hypothetical protein Ade02nite_52230 [Paractinoplanes deccanensis]|uniref:Uncharacterized protein n=1 Tax=Paractinoplanes deccanensis TaxID=113561 RepID=A0ABQ3Y9A0_9ACTN|nr:hypothetical protein Ade02nite_52230 [Actinoplanes deccanensis]
MNRPGRRDTTPPLEQDRTFYLSARRTATRGDLAALPWQRRPDGDAADGDAADGGAADGGATERAQRRMRSGGGTLRRRGRRGGPGGGTAPPGP